MICTVLDYASSWVFTALSGTFMIAGLYWVSLFFIFTPISIQGILRTPYLLYRLKQEWNFLKNSNAHKHKMKQYRTFFKWVFLINYLRFPPLPLIPVQLDNFAGPLMTFPRGGKLNALYINYSMQSSEKMPRIFKTYTERVVSWVMNKLP